MAKNKNNLERKLSTLEMFLIHYDNLSTQLYHMTSNTNYVPGACNEVQELENIVDDYRIKAQRVCKYLREHYKDIEKNDEFRRITDIYDFVYYSRHYENVQ